MTERQRTAIVVAGGSGMGADAARRLAEEGYGIAILSSSGRGEALARELGGVGVTGTNRSAADLERLVTLTMERFGRIDVLVNSAGHGPKGPLLELTDADWHEGMEAYLLNVIRAARLVTPIMRAQGGGAIINISSYVALEPDPAFPTSSVFRAGLAAFARLFARTHAADNIRMNNILPGFIDSLPGRPEFVGQVPMGRQGRSRDEIAATVAFLASDGAAYITGENIRVDGAISRGL